MSDVVMPGSVIGVLGSGQLGRMFAIAARQMGYRVHVLSPDDDTPTGQVADVEIQTDYEDMEAVARFARAVSVITFEFENVPVTTAEVAARHARVRPAGQVLHTTQNRRREKSFLQSAGLPVTPFAPVGSVAELEEAMDVLGLPAVLKTAAWGYDGKGQVRVDVRDQAPHAWSSLGGGEAVLERWIDFAAEISVVAVRGVRGEIACYEPVHNTHRHHILDVSVTPAGVAPRVAAAAQEIAREVMNRLEVVGVLCVEFFLTADGELLINELAPRPHNSGHLTIDAHVTSQFEQQVRAICGLPLGSTAQLQPAAMANLLGDLWAHEAPAWDAACAVPNVKLHLYGKREPRPGRKMGHLTALADAAHTARELVCEARRRLHRTPGSS
ncbi:MAG: 5-(carboxyamino)imidazole ribonucleotide synthase [Pirellulaceae bacterium]|jgi:5-(carboxyamino)imidazole ribonucleotide synthase|nr:5-(carboxyamino)imidazole ribonucleotide synthase [Pirellulaceae bacterium]